MTRFVQCTRGGAADFDRLIISEQFANIPRFSCAKHVTWTRRYSMTHRDKALIFLALGGLTKIEGKSVNLRMKKPANALTWRAFNLVAGVGFEPTTFRL
ncbi:MAG: hypothetical protein WBG18_18745 [Xanthobacteraceae bacterium]